jgi:hypothetical protein
MRDAQFGSAVINYDSVLYVMLPSYVRVHFSLGHFHF